MSTDAGSRKRSLETMTPEERTVCAMKASVKRL